MFTKNKMTNTGIVLLLCSLPKVALATIPDTYTTHSLGFFSQHIDKESKKKDKYNALGYSIKSWVKITTTTPEEHLSPGMQAAIGPHVTWRFIRRLGVQIGLLYSYHYSFPLIITLNGEKIKCNGALSFFNRISHIINSNENGPKKAQNDLFLFDTGSLTAHTLIIPLYLRFYLSNDFVLYGGGYFILPLSINRDPILSTEVPKDKLFKFLEDNARKLFTKQEVQNELLKTGKEIFVKHNKNSLDEISLPWFAWDLGLELQGESGFILGINMIGLTLGYDFTKLLLKS